LISPALKARRSLASLTLNEPLARRFVPKQVRDER
jgi:hypothetical protein